jgi:hypothetical protein
MSAQTPTTQGQPAQEPTWVWMFWIEPRRKEPPMRWCEARLRQEATWYVLERFWVDADGAPHRDTLIERIGQETYPARVPLGAIVTKLRGELTFSGYNLIADGPMLPTDDAIKEWDIKP